MMRELLRNQVASLGLDPDNAALLDRQFDKKTKVIIPTIVSGKITALAIYNGGYFRRLMNENRLPIMEEDQLVIGLD